MKIVLASMFRNSTAYLDRYFGQALALKEFLESRGDTLQFVMVEGDSTDDTFVQLARRTRTFDAILLRRHHGGRHAWHSVDIPERWKALSWVCNGVLDHIEEIVDALVYVEADLAWDFMSMVRLIDQLNDEHPAISPMCFTNGPRGEFYDLWGHIKDGVGFGPFPPYHHALGPGLTVVDSAGSCVAMLGKVARCVRYGPHDLVRGLGRSIREHGYSLWVDPHAKVIHL